MKAGLETPVGAFWVEARDEAVVSAGWGPVAEPGSGSVLAQAIAELEAYFAGRLTAFEVPIRVEPKGLQGAVMQAMLDIPFGETRTYGDLSRVLGAPAQAIGQACGGNCIPILVPCHRILGASGLGGFSAPGGVETKVALLKHEGAASLLI